MKFPLLSLAACVFLGGPLALPADPVQAEDPAQARERTSFQTGKPWNPLGNLRGDVAMAYGIDATLPERVKTWRDHGYRVHLMTGVSWGEYQDYLYGRFDGVNHEDNAQTDRFGHKIGHGGDVYYMCPAENYGAYLCTGVQRALDAGVEAIHLEEPEFWARAGWSEGFKREWQAFYHEPWQSPDSSVDAQWRASRLKYFLYRRALQQVFDYVQAYNGRTGRTVRCYVPTHSLINYAHWCIVSPESSLARLQGCDGYIAQIWTGTSRTPNWFRGVRQQRTFETAFLEYGAMQNLVRATGRTVWYLNDPVEDNPQHDWTDYRGNWEATLTASLLQPGVSQYEIAPWPERVFGGRYPRNVPPAERKAIPPDYASELQVVWQALADMKQASVEWDSGTRQLGVLVSDSLMFQREQPTPSDPDMSHFYGLALPLLKRGAPVTPVQLENVTLPGFLDSQRVLLLSYEGQKPLTADVHGALADWVKKGGFLVMVDDDKDPYNKVHAWWNEDGKNDRNPRQHLFETLGVKDDAFGREGADPVVAVGQGGLIWLRENPAAFARNAGGDARLAAVVKLAAEKAGLIWRETNYLTLRRGPYLVAAGLEEGVAGEPKALGGRLINLFDPELRVQGAVTLAPGTRALLLDLDKVGPATGPKVIASACRALLGKSDEHAESWTVEGVGDTPAVVLIQTDKPPQTVHLEGKPLDSFTYDAANRLLYVHFSNEARPRALSVEF